MSTFPIKEVYRDEFNMEHDFSIFAENNYIAETVVYYGVVTDSSTKEVARTSKYYEVEEAIKAVMEIQL